MKEKSKEEGREEEQGKGKGRKGRGRGRTYHLTTIHLDQVSLKSFLEYSRGTTKRQMKFL
jgi:hypothetical protein